MKLFGTISATIVSFALGISAPAYAQQDQHEPQPQHEQQQPQKEKPAEPAEKHAQEEPKKAQPNPKEQQRQGQQEKAQQEKAQQEKAQQEKVQQDKSAMQDKRQTEQEKAQQNKNAQRDNSMQQAKPSAQQNVQRSGEKEQKVKTETRTTEKVKVEKTTFQAHRATNWKVDHRNWQQRGGYHGYRIPEVRFRTYFGPEHYFRIAGLPFVVVSGNPRFQYNGFWFTMVDPWPEYWAADWYDTDDVYVAYVDDGYYMFDRRYPTEGIAINISL